MFGKTESCDVPNQNIAVFTTTDIREAERPLEAGDHCLDEVSVPEAKEEKQSESGQGRSMSTR